ncbi:uncharacterized protein MONBRDRAFT_10160 [Monosiga brevicollis MX1]|uniref:Uncharacterized protein n=1 Tax=Monosiga brevicollis TaxID=81824 RepID=A9V5D9_MONBE|nr:uncharacterized protein MONBRDRAFT_10160 [Monosiga brevicollis MX1]EDQ87355.1 predicted protein [Monosiga brevicollis MX1]|eukprot:XP_001747968.1 hypothetical protein [Monosiga brevicollis MX1]
MAGKKTGAVGAGAAGNGRKAAETTKKSNAATGDDVPGLISGSLVLRLAVLAVLVAVLIQLFWKPTDSPVAPAPTPSAAPGTPSPAPTAAQSLPTAAIPDLKARAEEAMADSRTTCNQLIRAANAYLQVEDYDNAFSWMDQAIQLEPSNSDFVAVRGEWALKAGRVDDAVEQLERALEIILHLDPGTWRKTLLQVERVLKQLVHVYKRSHYLAFAHAGLDVLATMFPNNEALTQEHAEYSYVSNGFGFSAVHNAAAAGLTDLLSQLINAGAVLAARNSLQQTPLHLAVMRGHAEMVHLLVQLGLPVAGKDSFGRSALDMACLHYWHQSALLPLLHDGSCPDSTKPLRAPYVPSHFLPDPSCQLVFWLLIWPCSNDVWARRSLVDTPLEMGGWKIHPDLAEGEARHTCEIDVVQDIDAETFLRDYLSLQRPVLIRNALGTPGWERVRKHWQRDAFFNVFGDLTFPKGAIPYAGRFDKEENITSIRGFMAEMDDVAEAFAKGITTPVPPQYIFASLAGESPLLQDAEVPRALNPSITEIASRNVQVRVLMSRLCPRHSICPAYWLIIAVTMY